jgi:ABC-type oligopeptide transport system ATPase subunit
MSAGAIVESGDAEQVTRTPIHPVTIDLLAAVPTTAKHVAP